MQIKAIEVNNFKSLIDFKLDLAKFSCLIGLNGVGKSTVLQFFEFLSHLMTGDIESWLIGRGWKQRDLLSRLVSDHTIDFKVTLTDGNGNEGSWEAKFDALELRCISEKMLMGDCFLELDAQGYSISRSLTKPDGESQRVTFNYHGSILSQLLDLELPQPILRIKYVFIRMNSLGLLSPHILRKRTNKENLKLGSGAARLSAFLYGIGEAGRQKITSDLKKIYPQLISVNAQPLPSGRIQLDIDEQFGDRQFRTEARHINDGMLRLLAILAECQTNDTFFLIDEVENGVNPELVEFLINTLLRSRQQILLTTHSPVILNYLDDETAHFAVIYLYKTAQGYTKSIPFFSIPSLAKKLTMMGPGEAFADTNLTLLADEIEQMAAGS